LPARPLRLERWNDLAVDQPKTIDGTAAMFAETSNGRG
jgi:hypothetical protein